MEKEVAESFPYHFPYAWFLPTVPLPPQSKEQSDRLEVESIMGQTLPRTELT